MSDDKCPVCWYSPMGPHRCESGWVNAKGNSMEQPEFRMERGPRSEYERGYQAGYHAGIRRSKAGEP